MNSLHNALLFSLSLLTISSVGCDNPARNANLTQDSTKTSAGFAGKKDTTTLPPLSYAIKPKGMAPSWAPEIKPEMLAVIERLERFGDRPIDQLSPQEARKNHTPTDAVKALVKENKIELPASKVDTAGRQIPVAGGEIHLRIYTPKNTEGVLPVVVYYHGGGFVIADLDVYSASAEAIAEKAGAVVVSVAYRQSPEYKFPIPIQDSYAAYRWVALHAASIHGDPKRIAVMGESAGGNIALNVSIMARDQHFQLPVYEVLVYPVAGTNMNTPSYKTNALAKPLNKAMMGWFVKHYTSSGNQASDPRINLLAAKLDRIEPTTIITASIDPLKSEGIALFDTLTANGIPVNYKNYEGVTHEFFGMSAVVPQAAQAQQFAADQLKKAFNH